MKTLLSTAAMILFVAAGTAGAQTMAPASPDAPSPAAPPPSATPAPAHEEPSAAPEKSTDNGEAAKPEHKHMMHKARWTSEEAKEEAETKRLNQAELKSDITPSDAPSFSKSSPPTE
jgi:hypothetical protein